MPLLETLASTLCNTDPARAIDIFGHTSPLCARCTGLYSGLLVGVLAAYLVVRDRPSTRSLLSFVVATALVNLGQVAMETGAGVASTASLRLCLGAAMGLALAALLRRQLTPSRRTRALLMRRAPDLLMSMLIVGWIVACAKNKKSSSAAPANALAAEQPAAGDGSAGPAHVATDAPSISNLERIAESKTCQPVPSLNPMLIRAANAWERPKIAKEIKEPGHTTTIAVTEWLIVAHRHQTLCNSFNPGGQNARDFVHTVPPIDEPFVDAALASKRCAILVGVDELDIWPFAARFANEATARDFSAAEVTRVLWKETLEQYRSECGDFLSRRQQIAVKTRVAKLDRIIGLDDQVLIGLRSKMLTALEQGDSQAVLAYSRAITGREKAIDSRNAAQYEDKLKSIEAAVKAQSAELSRVASGQGSASQPTGPTAADRAANAAQTTANVAKTAKNVAKTVQTTRQILGAFGL